LFVHFSADILATSSVAMVRSGQLVVREALE